MMGWESWESWESWNFGRIGILVGILAIGPGNHGNHGNHAGSGITPTRCQTNSNSKIKIYELDRIMGSLVG